MKNRNPNILHKLGTTSTTTKVEGVENLEETVQLTSKAIITAYQNNCAGNRNVIQSGGYLIKAKPKMTRTSQSLQSITKRWQGFCERVTDTPACAQIHKVPAKKDTSNKVELLKKNDNTYTKTAEKSLNLLMKARFPTATQIIGIPDPSSELRLQRPKSQEWKIAKVTPAKVRVLLLETREQNSQENC